MNKIKIIALFGKSAAGKDTIQKMMLEQNNNYHRVISCTTRPKRDYEEEGVDYFFLTEDEFATKTISGDMLETTIFRNWFYGTPIDGLDPDKTNVGVFNISGIANMLKDERLDVHPVYIQATDKTRLMRALQREENPDCAEICRRYMTDEEDFQDIPFEYKVFDNERPLDENILQELRLSRSK